MYNIDINEVERLIKLVCCKDKNPDMCNTIHIGQEKGSGNSYYLVVQGNKIIIRKRFVGEMIENPHLFINDKCQKVLKSYKCSEIKNSRVQPYGTWLPLINSIESFNAENVKNTFLPYDSLVRFSQLTVETANIYTTEMKIFAKDRKLGLKIPIPCDSTLPTYDKDGFLNLKSYLEFYDIENNIPNFGLSIGAVRTILDLIPKTIYLRFYVSNNLFRVDYEDMEIYGITNFV